MVYVWHILQALDRAFNMVAIPDTNIHDDLYGSTFIKAPEVVLFPPSSCESSPEGPFSARATSNKVVDGPEDHGTDPGDAGSVGSGGTTGGGMTVPSPFVDTEYQPIIHEDAPYRTHSSSRNPTAAAETSTEMTFPRTKSVEATAALEDDLNVAQPVTGELRMSLKAFIAIMTFADQHASGSVDSNTMLSPVDKAALLFSLADTDGDDSLSLTEFYAVCYLWRYARIRSINSSGEQLVRIGHRHWVELGTEVHYRRCDGAQSDPEWGRGVVIGNTEEGLVKLKLRGGGTAARGRATGVEDSCTRYCLPS